jgi:hypothetical protein
VKGSGGYVSSASPGQKVPTQSQLRGNFRHPELPWFRRPDHTIQPIIAIFIALEGRAVGFRTPSQTSPSLYSHWEHWECQDHTGRREEEEEVSLGIRVSLSRNAQCSTLWTPPLLLHPCCARGDHPTGVMTVSMSACVCLCSEACLLSCAALPFPHMLLLRARLCLAAALRCRRHIQRTILCTRVHRQMHC